MQKVALLRILRDMWTSGGDLVKVGMILIGAALLLILVRLGYGAVLYGLLLGN